MASFLSALLVVLQPGNLLALFVCAVIGVILGAIPGLAGGMGITLILPLTFAMTTELSFSMLLGMYVGGVSGAFIASVLVGIPGSASAIATCYDGYPMTKKGKAAKAYFESDMTLDLDDLKEKFIEGEKESKNTDWKENQIKED